MNGPAKLPPPSPGPERPTQPTPEAVSTAASRIDVLARRVAELEINNARLTALEARVAKLERLNDVQDWPDRIEFH